MRERRDMIKAGWKVFWLAAIVLAASFGAERLPAAGDRIDRSMGHSNRARGDAGSVGAKPAAFQFTSHATLRLSNPRNAQPPILTGSDGSSRNPFNRANRLGSATSATMAREAKAPAQ